MHGSSGRAMCSLNSVSGHLHLSHKNLGLTDPLISATDSDHEQVGKRDGSNGMITKLEKDEEGWAILPSMGNHSLKDCKHLIRDYISKIYHKLPSTWMVMYTGLTLDPVQNIIVRIRGLMCIGKRWCNPHPLSLRRRISLQGYFFEIHPTSARRRSSPSGNFWPPAKRMGMLASSSLVVTHEIKEKTWGWGLPGRPRERGRTSQGLIAHHHPLTMRMKRAQGMSPLRMKLGKTWGH